MKLFKMFLCALLCICFVQCDTAERRKSKAEDAIEKHLFETLDNFQSYEKISTEVDTLKDLWLAHPEIISFAEKLCAVEDNRNTIDEDYAQLESRSNALGRELYRGYTKAKLLEFMISAHDLTRQKEQLAERKIFLDSIHASLSDNLNAKVSSLEMPKDPYWHVTQKFRISEDGQDTKIHIAHYIFEPNMKEIIFSWDENDIRAQRLINLVSGIIIGSNEIFDAITEDEE